jgi:hypothetical protein
MKKLIAVALLLMMAGCGSTYNLKTGGWVIHKDAEKGTCLIVHGDNDPEVVVICIADPEPLKLPKSIIDAACPKCAECPAEEKTDGAE